MEYPLLTLEELERFLTKYRKKGQMMVSVLGEINKDLQSVFGTEIGESLLRSDMSRMDEILVKIVYEKATLAELAEFRFLRDTRIPSVVTKLNEYLKTIGNVRKSLDVK